MLSCIWSTHWLQRHVLSIKHTFIGDTAILDIDNKLNDDDDDEKAVMKCYQNVIINTMK